MEFHGTCPPALPAVLVATADRCAELHAAMHAWLDLSAAAAGCRGRDLEGAAGSDCPRCDLW